MMGGLIDRLKRSGPGRFAAKYGADRADDGAILIAWTALFSLFPLIIGLLAVLGLFLRDPGRAHALGNAIQTQFPSEVAELLSFLQETRDISGWLGLISVAGLLWSGSAFFGAMAQVFNRFYGVGDRGFVWQKLMAFGMIFVYVVMILITVLASGVPTFLVGLSQQLPFQVPGFALGIGWLVSVATAVVTFLVLYRVVPNASLQLRDVWRGAVLAGVLFVILNQVFPLYLQMFGGGFAAYKALGLFLLLMTWFYLLARIIVLGAELNAFLAGRGAATTEEEVARVEAERRGVQVEDGTGARACASDSPGKVMLWAGLTAGVTGLTLAVARRAAAGVWRATTGQEPPK